MDSKRPAGNKNALLFQKPPHSVCSSEISYKFLFANNYTMQFFKRKKGGSAALKIFIIKTFEKIWKNQLLLCDTHEIPAICLTCMVTSPMAVSLG